MRMRSKILLLCLCSTILALVLQTFLFQRASSKIIYNQAKEESFSSLQNMQNEIYTFIRNIESNLIEVYNNKDFMKALKSKSSVENIRKDFYRLAYGLATEDFQTSDGVVALYIYNDDHEIISTYRRATTPKHNYPRNIYQNEEKYNSAIVKNYISTNNTNMLISSYYNENRDTNIARFVLKIYNNSNIGEKIGYIVCDIDSKVLHKIIEKYRTQKEVFIWLQPLGDKEILTSGILEASSQDYYTKQIKRIENGKLDNYGDFVYGKQILFRVSQNKYNLDAYAMMPQAILEENQRSLTKSLLLIMLVMSVVITILSIWISKGLTKPLEQLTRTIVSIRSGNTRQRVKNQKRDEIGELGHEFNEMLDEIERLISHEYESKYLLNKAEYKALQAQINPHFLYNTLDTMSSIASIQNCNVVSDLCQSLSNIFRYSLDYKHPYSTIVKEIVHLKNYIFVMNIRMGENVEYVFDIDENILQDSIPRLSMQPIVENALNHGIRNKKGDKCIEIIAKESEGVIQIIVKDNGVGMDAEEMNQRLRENNLNAVESGSSIGLLNINARMKMLYGEEYGLHIMSNLQQGTSVILTIPIVKVEEVASWKENPTSY